MRWAFALLGLLLLQSGHATTYRELTPEEAALAADIIVVASVDSVLPSQATGMPWTTVTFRVEEWLAHGGEPVPEEPDAELPAQVTLEFLGGSSGTGESLTVSGLPQFRPGQRVLLFAYEADGLASPIVGVRQAVWTLDARGARHADGHYLSVPEGGRLGQSGTGAGQEELLAALRALLEAGSLPAPDEPVPPAEPEALEEPVNEASGADSDEDSAATSDAPRAEGAEQPGGQESGSEDATEPESGAPATAPGVAAGEAPSEAPSEAPITVRYRVDESGGPLLLSSAVAQAAAAWVAAAPGTVAFVDVDAQQGTPAEAAASAPHLIRYGDPGLFGPDALSFTLVRPGNAATEILVSPTARETLHAVLLHSLGLLAGLPEGGAGVMAGTVTAVLSEPTAADVEALTALRDFRPEDVNRDGVVDFYDLVALAEAFGTRGVNLAADLDGDGTVSEADLELLRQAYQFLPPSETAPD
ncbi:MAG: dockerin type I domain-containing protein [Trueperaceae bacterium]